MLLATSENEYSHGKLKAELALPDCAESDGLSDLADEEYLVELEFSHGAPKTERFL